MIDSHQLMVSEFLVSEAYMQGDFEVSSLKDLLNVSGAFPVS